MATTESVKTNRFSDTFGYASGRAATKVVEYMSPYVQEFIKNSPLVIQASTDVEGNCDASPKGGMPGFVKILDDSRIIIPDVAGNKLFQSYLNITENPKIGLVFFIPGVRETARVNGTSSTRTFWVAVCPPPVSVTFSCATGWLNAFGTRKVSGSPLSSLPVKVMAFRVSSSVPRTCASAVGVWFFRI